MTFIAGYTIVLLNEQGQEIGRRPDTDQSVTFLVEDVRYEYVRRGYEDGAVLRYFQRVVQRLS